MSNDLVKNNKFKATKRSLVNLKQGAPSGINLPQFPTSGEIFRFTKHNVTGQEANDNLVKPLQTTIITLNTYISNLLSFIDDIYGLIDWLDNEYTKGIETAVNAAKESSSQALKASQKAQKASEKASKAQEDIKRTIAALQLTVEKLKVFKDVTTKRIGELSKDVVTDLDQLHHQLDDINKEIGEVSKQFSDDIAGLQEYKSQLEAYEHLGDVDAMWNDVESHKKNLAELHQKVDGFIKEIGQVTGRISEDISALQQYRTTLESYSHLGDIDAMWNDVESHKKNLAELHQKVDGFIKEIGQVTGRISEDISALQQYRTTLESYSHLGDIDAMWNDVESHKKNLAELHQKVDGFIKEIGQVTGRISEDISALQQYRTTLESYSHLGDIDAMWNDIESHKKNLAELHQKVDGFIKEIGQVTGRISEDISALQQYRTTLESYSHLGDIDAMWNDVEGNKKNLSELNQQQKEVRKAITDISDRINVSEQTIKERDIRVDKKIKIAYGIAGGSLALTIIQLVLQLLGIL